MIHHEVSSLLILLILCSNFLRLQLISIFFLAIDRTAELRKLGFPTRHLGPMQMTTDTALGVTKIVVQDLSMLKFSPVIMSLVHCFPLTIFPPSLSHYLSLILRFV